MNYSILSHDIPHRYIHTTYSIKYHKQLVFTKVALFCPNSSWRNLLWKLLCTTDCIRCPHFADLPLKICHCVHIMKGDKLTFTQPTMQDFMRIKSSHVLLSAVSDYLRNYSLFLLEVACLRLEKVRKWKLKCVLHLLWVKAYNFHLFYPLCDCFS